MKRRCWILRVVVAALGCAILLGIGLIGYRLPTPLGFCLNLTPSEPVGIYRVVAGGPERGALVWLKQPVGPASAILNRYVPANIPLIKRVAAIPGDIVELGPHNIRVNGIVWADSSPMHRDEEGRPLPAYSFGTYRLAAGQLWVMSNHPRGIDSRYFGPVAKTSVISRVAPVITWSSPETSQALLLAHIITIAAMGVLLAVATVKKAYALVITPRELRQE